MITSTYNVREKNANVFAYIKIRKLKAVFASFVYRFDSRSQKKKKTVSGNSFSCMVNLIRNYK